MGFVYLSLLETSPRTTLDSNEPENARNKWQIIIFRETGHTTPLDPDRGDVDDIDAVDDVGHQPKNGSSSKFDRLPRSSSKFSRARSTPTPIIYQV